MCTVNGGAIKLEEKEEEGGYVCKVKGGAIKLEENECEEDICAR